MEQEARKDGQREQVRRDAEEAQRRSYLSVHVPPDDLLALLAELEQAERERDEAMKWTRSGTGNEPVSERDGLIAQLMEAENELHLAIARAVNAESRLASVPALVEALRECDEEGRALTADLIAVKLHLDDPYPDDPRWTPWTRFVERGLRRLDAARKKARAALTVYEQSQGNG